MGLKQLTVAKMIDTPPMWLAGALVLVWVQGRMLPVGPPPGQILYWAGGGLILLGLGLIVAAGVVMRRHRTTIIPHLEPAKLVRTGIFALSRNPIYLGDALILTGCALRWQAYPALVLVPLFMWLISRRFITAEEARLRRAFGKDFDDYAGAVRRWI